MEIKEAISIINQYDMNFHWNDGELIPAEQLAEAFDLAISALEKQEQDRWIPVTERLPEVHEAGNSFSGLYMQSNPVLVYGIDECSKDAQFHVVTYCDDLDGYTYWTESDALTVNGVKAWRPLPEPYQEEDNE